MTWLPTPLELGATGTGLVALAGVMLWLIPSQIRFILCVGLLGAFLLACSGVAFGYEKMGEAKIIPERDKAIKDLNDYRTKQQDYIAKLTLDGQEARDEIEAVSKQRQDAIKGYFDVLDQKAKADVVARNTMVPRSLLDDAIAAANAGAANTAGPAAGTSEEATAAAVIAYSEVQQWGIEASRLYASCVAEVDGWQSFYQRVKSGQTTILGGAHG